MHGCQQSHASEKHRHGISSRSGSCMPQVRGFTSGLVAWLTKSGAWGWNCVLWTSRTGWCWQAARWSAFLLPIPNITNFEMCTVYGGHPGAVPWPWVPLALQARRWGLQTWAPPLTNGVNGVLNAAALSAGVTITSHHILSADSPEEPRTHSTTFHAQGGPELKRTPPYWAPELYPL